MNKMMVFLTVLMLLGAHTLFAQQTRCPLTGTWANLKLGGNWGEASITLFAVKKIGQNPFKQKLASNGYIDVTDIYFEEGIIYNLVYEKTLAPNTYQFATTYTVGRQARSGKLQIKKNGRQIIVTGIDALTKKQPIHGKVFQSTSDAHDSGPMFDNDSIVVVQ